MSGLEMWELASYVVTVIGLPFAILIFFLEQRKERQNEDEEMYLRLADEYTDFLKLCLENADLGLLHPRGRSEATSPELEERRRALFGILISLFERAYMLVYEESMDRQTRRMWESWEDFMREWCRKPDFRAALPTLLEGEDEDFARHILRLVDLEQVKS